MRVAFVIALLPVVCLGDTETGDESSKPVAQIFNTTESPCASPNAAIQFRRLGSMSTFRPADVSKAMLVEPGQYELVMECQRVPDNNATTCRELNRLKERAGITIELKARIRYVFTCKLEQGRVLFRYTKRHFHEGER